MQPTKTVLITGASRGIGRATALAFAREGWNVAANYNSAEAQAATLRKELRALGVDAEIYRADVSDRAQVQTMTEAVEARFGVPDALVCCAGIAQQKLFTDLSAADWTRMFAVNVDGVFHACQCVLPGMLRRHSGKIVTVSSIWGMTGASCEVHYSAAKAAVIGLTRALAKEVGPSGITVNCVAPGVIDTDMLADFDADDRAALRDETPLGVIGRAQDIAESILFLASERANFITGQLLSPNGGFVI